MYLLAKAFSGKHHAAHAARMAPFADASGRVPEPGDRERDFSFEDRALAWIDRLSQAQAATEKELCVWTRDATETACSTGFLWTATVECGLGRHELCPGWNRGGRFTFSTPLDPDAPGINTGCLCPTCNHAKPRR